MIDPRISIWLALGEGLRVIWADYDGYYLSFFWSGTLRGQRCVEATYRPQRRLGWRPKKFFSEQKIPLCVLVLAVLDRELSVGSDEDFRGASAPLFLCVPQPQCGQKILPQEPLSSLANSDILLRRDRPAVLVR